MEHRFIVNDMNCGHCIARINRAIREADPSARVVVDLPTRTVVVAGEVEPAVYAGAIADAGYSSIVV
jgi:copper chaperone